MEVFKTKDNFPEKILATILLAAGEMIGFGGYGLTDAYTFLAGVKDLRQKIYLRGGLKIAGALIPTIPSFWVAPVADWMLPEKQGKKA